MLTATTVITRRARRQSIRSEGAGNISSAPSRNYTEFGRYQLVQSRTTGALYAWSTTRFSGCLGPSFRPRRWRLRRVMLLKQQQDPCWPKSGTPKQRTLNGHLQNPETLPLPDKPYCPHKPYMLSPNSNSTGDDHSEALVKLL